MLLLIISILLLLLFANEEHLSLLYSIIYIIIAITNVVFLIENERFCKLFNFTNHFQLFIVVYFELPRSSQKRLIVHKNKGRLNNEGLKLIKV